MNTACASLAIRLVCAALLVSVGFSACGSPAMDVVFYINEGYTFSRAEQRTIETIATRTALDAKRMLPGLPAQLILRVNPRKKVMPETGQTAEVSPPNVVYWMVDPNLYGGVIPIAERQLRSTLLHEFHHLVRDGTRKSSGSLMERVIDEGLATAFERDFGDAPTPWGTYPPDVADWVKELMALPHDTSMTPWLSRHPDGRRWVGLKAGTYIVDRAIRASRKSAAELVTTPSAEVMRLAFGP